MFDLILTVKSQLKEIALSIYRILFTSTSYVDSKLDRLSFDNVIVKVTQERAKKRDKLPKISAVIRVKNGSDYIESSILSIAPLVSEVVIVDNNSSDETLKIAQKLKLQLNGICDVNIYSYNNKLEIAGVGYLKKVKTNPNGSLADFYNYSFSLAKHEYVIKWDAHAIMFDRAIDKIQEILSQDKLDAICFRGMEFYGKRLDLEMRMYRKDLDLNYFDSELYESIDFTNIKYSDISKVYIKTPFYLHMKRLSYVKSLNCENAIEDKYK